MSDLSWKNNPNQYLALNDLRRACATIHNLADLAIRDHSHLLIDWEEAFYWLVHDVLPAMVVEMEVRGDTWKESDARTLLATMTGANTTTD